jgi:hypothetical protein
MMRCKLENGMPHKFAVGASVYYEGNFPSSVARSPYKIVRQLPVERDNRIVYRIKSAAESFERTAEESQLSSAS